MSLPSDPSPLIQTLSPERWAGWSMDFIGAGYVGLLVKNGQLIRKLEPGRHFSFALPLLEQCHLVLVDNKVRNLEVLSKGDFLSKDQYVVNVSLSVMYQVIDPKRVALELSDPIGSLTSAVKDLLGVVINDLRLDQLLQQGRVEIRQYLTSHPDTFYLLGFNLDDVRVGDISFPQSRGVVRQVEGLTAREEASHQATLQQLGRSNPAGTQRVSSDPSSTPQRNAASDQPATAWFPGARDAKSLSGKPPAQRRPLPPTTLAPTTDSTTAHLVHQQTGAIVPLTTNPFTIGREPDNHLVSESSFCSRYHARIERSLTPDGAILYQLIDVGSSNGTFLNQQRLVSNQPAPLDGGAVIKIGDDEWMLQLS
ncbi:FHA domain-containing protein [Egbenema bharatensis]|uniref:FHA domain-containing protein n=1 Tax=Egbenema bharatensis TaxID=3463334 RepID=UPI003A860B4B